LVDQRRFSRVPFREPVVFVVKGGDDRAQGETRDICLGGMFIETKTPPPFGTEVVAHVHIPGEAQAFQLPGIVRWVRDDGMGLQFGNIGARETYAITAIVAQADKS
jgi:hypothetical protein